MSPVLFAQPYDLAATGFIFESVGDFDEKAAACRNAHGQRVEEFEVQFIDGEAIDAALAEALGLSQNHVAAFFEIIEAWDLRDKQAVIIAVGECGYRFEWDQTEPAEFDVDLYEEMSLRELAETFVEEGLFGDILERLAAYLDFDAIARDLSMDYAETTIAGSRVVYRCG
ncbi:MAG: antirestriction protein ArdA [Pseudomonadota bacterium]